MLVCYIHIFHVYTVPPLEECVWVLIFHCRAQDQALLGMGVDWEGGRWGGGETERRRGRGREGGRERGRERERERERSTRYREENRQGVK